MTTSRKRMILAVVLVLALAAITASFAFAADRGVWAPNVSYAVGDTVTYQDATHPNHRYQCQQAHTSIVTWEPPNTPALWIDLGPVGGATTPPPTTPPPTTPPGGTLPSPWQTQNVGTVGATGSASFSNGTFTVGGSGADIWNTADGFRYVYQTLSGDGQITARVVTQGNTNAWAKAGVMIRESTAAGSKHAMMVITPGNGLAFQSRSSTGGSSAHVSGGAASVPRWVRVARAGSTLTGYQSTNGSTWTQVGSVSISMNSSVTIGLAVTSHADGSVSTATFDNVSVTTGATPPPPTTPPPTTPPPPTGRMFAPYLDVSPGPNSTLGNLAGNRSNVSKMYTLAFILGRGCSAAWFGTFEMNTQEANDWATRINELRAVGGDVIIAFGGAAAPELANVCSTVSSLQAAYQSVITKYNLKYMDLDIEDFSPTAIDLRNKALKNLEAANPNLKVHYTLGVLPTGLTQAQIDVLNNAKANGTRVDVVNIMAMDYGQGVSDMGAAAISAAQATRTQLNNMGFTSTKIGITPMIGTNDTHETFTLQDAQEVEQWALNNGIVLLAFWSVGRDNGGCPNGTVSPSCSGISQSQWQFSSIFRPFMP